MPRLVFLCRMLVLVVAFLALVHAVPPCWGAASQYHVTVLGPGFGTAIDPIEETVVGSRPGARAAFILAATVRDLGLLPDGTFSNANGVFAGRVCGAASTGPFGLFTHAFVMAPDDSLVDLGTTGDAGLFSSCTALNQDKEVGFGDSPDRSTILPLVFTDGGIVIRETLGGLNGFIEAVSSAGDECGNSDTGDGDTHATCWFADEFTPVDLDGEPARISFARAINTARTVVGNVARPGLRCFVWDPDAGLRTLEPLPGDTQNSCTDVNASGDIVGSSVRLDPAGPGFLHQAAIVYEDGTPIDVSTRLDAPLPEGCTLAGATGISDRGTVLVNGTCDREDTVFLLTPVTLVAEALPSEVLPPVEAGASPVVEEAPAEEITPPVADDTQPPVKQQRRHHKRAMQLAKWMECHPHASAETKRLVREALRD
jgi:uncharacterized membrane protein